MRWGGVCRIRSCSGPSVRLSLLSLPSRTLLKNTTCTGDDCQLLLWDLAPHTAAASATSPRGGSGGGGGGGLSSPRPDAKKRVVADPVAAYTGAAEIANMAWSPTIPGMQTASGHTTGPGEWIAVAMGKSIKALKV